MDLQFETRLAQNAGLGAVVLWQFAESYMKATENESAPSLFKALLVVPLCVHKPTVEAVWRMQFKSGIVKALSDHPEIPVGLNARVESMLFLSFRSLSLACGVGLLKAERAQPVPRYWSRRRTLPPDFSTESADVKSILGASRRMGRWFAEVEEVALFQLLMVGV